MKQLNFRAILSILGVFLLIETIAILLCGIASIVYHENVYPLLLTAGITAMCGAFLYGVFRKSNEEIGKREGYIVVSTVWVFFSMFGSLPFLFSGVTASFTDAFFETMSGFTTTGASIITDIEAVDKGVLLWRSTTQWLGGIGIIVLSLAMLPMLGIGGMQLYAAEVPGPTKEKIHPKIKDTAQRFFAIYLLFTSIQTVLLVCGGMNWFDAINHAFTTMSSGGFSTYNDNVAHTSSYIQYVIIVFMFISGINFTLSYFALHGKFSLVWKNEEFRNYLAILITFALLITAVILLHTIRTTAHTTISFAEYKQTFRDALFHVVSLVTTSGFVTVDYLQWPQLATVLCFALMFFGSSAGSTGGGIKVVRLVLLTKHSFLELRRLIHPNAIIPVRLNKKVVPEKTITNVLAFIIIYIVIYMFGVILMSALGYDLETSLGAVVATLGNVGSGIGAVGPFNNYAFLTTAAKWILSFFMLCGRLELFTILILFSPAFWKN
ncbi:MAG: TrkH family potassium uptake protein [Bacteroidales bacterium]|nr:TrkH family potassium uptake protein [Bacteroidales bacterium]